MCRKPLYINGFRDLASRNLRQFLGVFYSLGPQMVPIAKDNNFLLCNIHTIFWLAEILNKYPVKKPMRRENGDVKHSITLNRENHQTDKHEENRVRQAVFVLRQQLGRSTTGGPVR